MTDAIKAFDFEQKEVRVITKDGEPWFVAKDVCEILDIQNSRDAIAKALDEDEHFPEAYYSRGVIYLITGKTEEGLSDLSQAGEYGIYSAYNLIKRHSIQKK